MDPKRIVALVVGAAVMVLIFSAILVPVIDDATTTQRTFTNEGYFFMDEIDEGTAMTVAWDYTEPTILTVNGEDVSLPDKDHMSTIPFTIFCCDTWYVRYWYDSTSMYFINIFQNASNTSYAATVTDQTSLSISVTDAGVTTVNNGSDHTWSNATGDFYIISETGDYVMKKMDKDAYVHGDSSIYGYGRTNARGYNYTSQLHGTVNDGITGAYYPESTITTAGWTISDVTLNNVAVSGYDDLYKISTMTYEITGEGIVPYTAIFSQYIVPAEVTANVSIVPDSGTRALLDAIPIIAMIGIVLAVVGVAIVGRNDY